MQSKSLHYITFHEILSWDIFKNIRVIGGSRGLNRRIESVNVMEVPDILTWVQKNQLLLTTAFSIKDDHLAQVRLIPELAKKGLSGLMIKPRRYIDHLPSEMIEAADEYAFPLLEMPEEVSHTMVLEAIYNALANKQAMMLKQSVETNQNLLEVVLEGGGLVDICIFLHKTFKNPVSIIGTDGIMLASSSKKIKNLEKLWLKKFFSKNGNTPLSRGIIRENLQLEDRECSFVSIPIWVSKRFYGNIFVFEFEKKIDENDYINLERVTTVAALSIINQKSVQVVEEKYFNEFLFDWLDGKIESEFYLRQLGKSIGLDFKNNFYNLSLIEVENSTNLTIDNQHVFLKTNLTINVFRKLIDKTLKLKKDSYILGERENLIVILLQIPHLTSQKDAGEIAKESGKLIIDEFSKSTGLNCSIGIGRFRTNLMEFPQCYKEAKMVINAIKCFDSYGNICNFDDLGALRLLYQADDMEIKSFAEQFYIPLEDYDRKNNTLLVATAQVFFECNANISKTSQKLYAHYNTIVYRIERIQQITGLNLEDTESRLNLQLALKIGMGRLIN